MKTGLFAFSVAAVAMTAVVVGAQHHARPAAHSAGGHEFVQQLCESHEAAAESHHAAMAATLSLSPEQLSEITRISTEACAVLTKYHEQILAVLTPEQRAKVEQLHGTAKRHDDKR